MKEESTSSSDKKTRCDNMEYIVNSDLKPKVSIDLLNAQKEIFNSIETEIGESICNKRMSFSTEVMYGSNSFNVSLNTHRLCSNNSTFFNEKYISSYKNVCSILVNNAGQFMVEYEVIERENLFSSISNFFNKSEKTSTGYGIEIQFDNGCQLETRQYTLNTVFKVYFDYLEIISDSTFGKTFCNLSKHSLDRIKKENSITFYVRDMPSPEPPKR